MAQRKLKSKIACKNLDKIEKKKNKQIILKNKQKAFLNSSPDLNMIKTLSMRRKENNKPKVLVVEDDPFVCRLVEKTLNKDFNIFIAKNADSALADYIANAPDILFLDIGLPDVSGHDVLKKIIECDPEAFIVMLSSKSDIGNLTRAIKNGASGFVGKPFNRDSLIQYIHKSPHTYNKTIMEM